MLVVYEMINLLCNKVREISQLVERIPVEMLGNLFLHFCKVPNSLNPAVGKLRWHEFVFNHGTQQLTIYYYENARKSKPKHS